MELIESSSLDNVSLDISHYAVTLRVLMMVLWDSPSPGVGKLFSRRATFKKNVAAEGRTLSLQSRKIYSVCK